MSGTNQILSGIFRNMASMYRYLGDDQRFRALAYSKASRVLNGLNVDILEIHKKNLLDDIPGIGKSIAQKINEYIKTGKIKKYEVLKRKVPHEILELMDISGFGPKSVKRLHEKLHINTKQQLLNAINEGRVQGLVGFGERKVENMRRSLKLINQAEKRILLTHALSISDRILQQLSKIKEVHQIEVAGSIRRKKETIGDIDILVSSSPKDRSKIIKEFIGIQGVKSVLAKGPTKVSILIHEFNRQVDLRIVDDEQWGASLLYLTGSKEHNVFLRTKAKKNGYKMNEYGVFRIRDGRLLAGKTEEEIYRLMGLKYIPPELREGKDEFELTKQKMISKLVTIDDVKGDMHLHSDGSDGLSSLEKMADYVQKYYTYDYIVMTDHSKSVRIAGGMNERELQQQINRIKRVNKKAGNDYIKTGVEVDILEDGSLDLNDHILEKLDWVCASIHSGFRKDNTERIIKACMHPYVNCIGHPTGRLIGKREGYSVDWVRVFKVAKATGTALEINAQPERMDLNDELCSLARNAGVKLVISTDSHSEKQFEFMKSGIFIARRAWCTVKDILNTQSWKTIEQFVQSKRKRHQIAGNLK